MLSQTELQKTLGVKAARLKKWIAAGLPCVKKGRNRTYDLAVVATWLQKTGRAVLEGPAPIASQVAATREEAARILQISPRQLSEWLTDPSFPGKAGSPGRRDGYFPIDQIEAWRASRFGGDGRAAANGRTAELRARRLEQDIDEAQIEIEKLLGTILDAEETALLAERQIATTKAILEEMPDRIESSLGRGVAAKERRRIRKVVQQSVAMALAAIAEAAAGDKDSSDDDEEA